MAAGVLRSIEAVMPPLSKQILMVVLCTQVPPPVNPLALQQEFRSRLQYCIKVSRQRAIESCRLVCCDEAAVPTCT